MTVSAYNDVETGPTSDNRIQQTEQAGQLVYSLLVHVSVFRILSQHNGRNARLCVIF